MSQAHSSLNKGGVGAIISCGNYSDDAFQDKVYFIMVLDWFSHSQKCDYNNIIIVIIMHRLLFVIIMHRLLFVIIIMHRLLFVIVIMHRLLFVIIIMHRLLFVIIIMHRLLFASSFLVAKLDLQVSSALINGAPLN